MTTRVIGDVEDGHPLQPAIHRWVARVPETVRVELYTTPISRLWPCHFTLMLVSQNAADANLSVQSFLDIVASGRRSLVRTRRDAEHERDFEHDQEFWKAYLRVMVWDEPGETTVAPTPEFPGKLLP